MRRRTLLQLSAAAVGSLRDARAQQRFPAPHAETLRAVARTVLPASFGDSALDALADRFAEWVRGYKPGAEMEHGYGAPRLRNKPPSPAATYLTQLADLERPGFVRLDTGARRAAIDSALSTGKVDAMPNAPAGKHVVVDLMSWYFNSSDAADLCYGAAIRREDCRGFAGGSAPPPPLKSRGA